MDFSIVLSRIKEVMNEKGFTIYSLTQEAGLSANTIYNWYKKNGCKPKIENLMAVCKVLEVDLTFLFYSGNKVAETQEEKMLRLFRVLPAKHKEMIIYMMENFLIN